MSSASFELPMNRPTPSLHILTLLPSSTSGDRIGRPRNAFMIFRKAYQHQIVSPFLADRKVPAMVVSKAAGQLWRNMSEEEQEPWNELCAMDKKKHTEMYPGYRFSPQPRRQRKGRKTYEEKQEEIAAVPGTSNEPFTEEQRAFFDDWYANGPVYAPIASSSSAPEFVGLPAPPLAEDWMSLYWDVNPTPSYYSQ